MSKHTPGPWTYDHTYSLVGSNGERVVLANSGLSFATAHEHPERVANTTLVVAAPMLLEALRDMVSDRDCLSEATVNFARAAIAAATGEDA